MSTPNVPELHTDGISPKAAVATLAAILAPLVIQAGAFVVEYFTANPALVESLPAWARFVVATLLTALSVAVAAYRAKPGTMTVVARPRR